MCLAATQPSYNTDVWATCNNLVNILLSNNVQWPTASWFCTTQDPVPASLSSADTLYFMCGSTNDLVSYQRLVNSIWALTSPSTNYNFQGQFLNLYITAQSRTNAASTMWSWFGCNTGRFPIGAQDSTWQLQYYQTGFVASPPPPMRASSACATVDYCYLCFMRLGFGKERQFMPARVVCTCCATQRQEKQYLLFCSFAGRHKGAL